MKMKRILVGAVAAGVASGLAAAPAFATSNVTVDSVAWTYYNDTSNSFGFSQIGDAEDLAPYGPYAGDGMWLRVEDPNVPGSYLELLCTSTTETTQADGDLGISCNSPIAPFAGLDFTATATIFSGDYHGLIGRLVYNLTNSSGTDLALNLETYYNTEECDAGAGVIGTSSADASVDNADSWMICNNDNKADEAMAWGDNWLTSWSNGNSNSPTSADTWKFDNNGLTLPTGATKTFVFFFYSEGTTDHGATYGDTDANLVANMSRMFDDKTSLYSSRLWEDLGAAENWAGSTDPATPSESALPNTGVDFMSLLAGGLALVLAGGIVVVTRHRGVKA